MDTFQLREKWPAHLVGLMLMGGISYLLVGSPEGQQALGKAIARILLVLPASYVFAIVVFKNFRLGLLFMTLMLPIEGLLSLGAAGSLLKILVVLVSLGLMVQIKRTQFSFASLRSPLTLWLSLFVLWSFLSMLWSVDPTLAFSRSTGYLGNLVLYALVVAAGSNWILTLWALLPFACALSVLAQPLLPGSGSILLPNGWIRFTTGGQDPNDMAGMFTIAIAIAWIVVRPRLTSPKIRFALAASVLIMGVAIFLSLSKTGLTAFVITLTVLNYRRFERHKIQFAMGVAAVCTALYLLNAWFENLIPAGLMDALMRTHSPNASLISGRSGVWEAAWDIVKSNPWLGVGSGNLPIYTVRTPGVPIMPSSSDYNLGLVAHNIVLSVWGELGTVGILLFVRILLAAFAGSFRLYRQGDPWGKALLLCLLLVLVIGTSLSWEYKKIFYLLLGTISLKTLTQPAASRAPPESALEPDPRQVDPSASPI